MVNPPCRSQAFPPGREVQAQEHHLQTQARAAQLEEQVRLGNMEIEALKVTEMCRTFHALTEFSDFAYAGAAPFATA